MSSAMSRLGLKLNDTEEQWEKDLEAELQEYEVVNNGTSAASAGEAGSVATSSSNFRNRSTPSNNDWEQYADIIDETDDLK